MSELFNLADLSFLGVLTITFGGAFIAVGARNIFHNVLGLALSLFGVAGIFVFLNSPFLAMMEILIYVGAICIAICFAIMLSEPLYLPRPPRKPIKASGRRTGRWPGLFYVESAGEENRLGPGCSPGHRLVGGHHRPLSADPLRPHL